MEARPDGWVGYVRYAVSPGLRHLEWVAGRARPEGRGLANWVVVKWTEREVLAAVEAALTGRPYSTWTFERADLAGHEVRVVFQMKSGEAGTFAAVYSLEPFEGPSTGEVCKSLRDWASEIAWDLDEHIGTGGLRWASRSIGEDGVVVLDWRR